RIVPLRAPSAPGGASLGPATRGAWGGSGPLLRPGSRPPHPGRTAWRNDHARHICCPCSHARSSDRSRRRHHRRSACHWPPACFGRCALIARVLECTLLPISTVARRVPLRIGTVRGTEAIPWLLRSPLPSPLLTKVSSRIHEYCLPRALRGSGTALKASSSMLYCGSSISNSPSAFGDSKV